MTKLPQLLVRLVLAGLLGWAGLSKLGDPSALAEAVANYRLLQDWAVPLVAAVLPATEIVVAAALVAGPCVQGGAGIAALMLGAFAVGMAQAKMRGIDLDCGCFGAGFESQVSWTKVAINSLLATAAGLVAWARPVAWHQIFPGSAGRGNHPSHGEEATG